MSTDIKILKELISNSVSKNTGLSDQTKTLINNTVQTLSPTIPVVISGLDNKLTKFNVEEVKVNFSLDSNVKIKKIKKIQSQSVSENTKYIAQTEGGPIIMFNENWVNLSTIPFDYLNNISTSEYYDVSDIDIVEFNTEQEKGSILLVSCKSKHIVQIYKIVNNIWTYVGRIGTLNTANYTPNHLDLPECLSGLYSTSVSGVNPDSSIKRLVVYISCLGDNGVSVTKNSFIKKFVINVSDWSVFYEGMVLYPDIIISTSLPFYDGSMANLEIFNVSKLKIIDDTRISMVSNTDEFGIVKFTDNTPIIEMFTKGIISELPYKDKINPIRCFDFNAYGTSVLLNGMLIAGDSLGHVFALDQKLKPMYCIGILNNSTSEYPFHYNQIDDIFVDNNLVYFISNGKIFSCNPNIVQDNFIDIDISTMSVEYKVKDIIGIPDKFKISFYKTSDVEKLYTLDEMKYIEISPYESLVLRLEISKKDLIENIIILNNICLILEI